MLVRVALLSGVPRDGAGGEVRIFDVAAGDWVGPQVVRHEGNVSWLAWSADSRTVVSSGFDGQLALWDGESGSLLGGLALEAAAGAPQAPACSRPRSPPAQPSPLHGPSRAA